MPSVESQGAVGLPAERVGFEPTEAVNRLNGLASRRLKPLSHLSVSKCGLRQETASVVHGFAGPRGVCEPAKVPSSTLSIRARCSASTFDR